MRASPPIWLPDDGTYHARCTFTVLLSPRPSFSGTASEAALASFEGGFEVSFPSLISRHANVSGSNHTLRNQQWLTTVAGSPVKNGEMAFDPWFPAVGDCLLREDEARSSRKYRGCRRLVVRRHEIIVRSVIEYGLDSFVGRIRERVFQGSDRQTGVVSVGRNKGTPACYPNVYGYVLVLQDDLGERKTGCELSIVETGHAEERLSVSAAGFGASEFLPVRTFDFKDFGTVFHAFQVYGCEHARLVEKVHVVAYGHMGDRAGPFQAEHAGSHSSDRECHTVEEFAGIRSVVVSLSESMEGDVQTEDADENLFHDGLLLMLKFGEGV